MLPKKKPLFQLLERARTEGKLTIEAPVWANLVSSFEYLETSNRKILNHGWVNFPVAYTQVSAILNPKINNLER